MPSTRVPCHPHILHFLRLQRPRSAPLLLSALNQCPAPECPAIPISSIFSACRGPEACLPSAQPLSVHSIQRHLADVSHFTEPPPTVRGREFATFCPAKARGAYRIVNTMTCRVARLLSWAVRVPFKSAGLVVPQMLSTWHLSSNHGAWCFVALDVTRKTPPLPSCKHFLCCLVRLD